MSTANKTGTENALASVPGSVPATQRNDPSVRPAETPGPESSARIAALQINILDLERQLAALSEVIARNQARSHTHESDVATVAGRMAALEAELRACSDARDTAGAVAATAVAELRQVKAMCNALRRDLEAASSERDTALATASAAQARVAELESAAKANRGDNAV